MQITIDTLAATRTGLAAANVKKRFPGIDTSFLAAISAVEMTDAPVAAVNAENKVAVNETAPAEIYQAATGRTVEKDDSAQSRWNDEMFARAVGHGEDIDTSKSINWDSIGEKELTEEQIKYLKEKYDVDDLSPQEYYDLMSELTNMDALSAEDCVGITLLHTGISEQGWRLVPEGVPSMLGWSRTGNMSRDLQTALDRLLENWKWMKSDDYRRMNNLTEEEWAADLSAIEKDIRARQAVKDLLALLR